MRERERKREERLVAYLCLQTYPSKVRLAAPRVRFYHFYHSALLILPSGILYLENLHGIDSTDYKTIC